MSLMLASLINDEDIIFVRVIERFSDEACYLVSSNQGNKV